MRKKFGGYLNIERYVIGFDHAGASWLDVAEFEASMLGLMPTIEAKTQLSSEQISQLEAALALYRGDFLAGFYLRDNPYFEDWSILRREQLQRLAISGMRALVSHYDKQGQYERAILIGKRLVTVDPLQENAHQQLMWHFVRNGERPLALKQFEKCRHILDKELGIEPTSKTTEIHQRILKSSWPPPYDVPRDGNIFIGREDELQQIDTLLIKGNASLLTIVGPGGQGKSSVALATADQIRQKHPGRFIDGIYFLPLARLTDISLIPATIANALKIDLRSSTLSQQLLTDEFREKELLLILDNFEHLIDRRSMEIIAGILFNAPKIKILITSREPLGLVEEQLLTLSGLPYPPYLEIGDIFDWSATELFVKQARRHLPDFSPAESDLAAITELCKFTDGHPLALELAATGKRYLSCEQILSALKNQLDWDAGLQHNREPRQRNINAVFNHSWHLLKPDEQQQAMKLAVLGYTFTLEAV